MKSTIEEIRECFLRVYSSVERDRLEVFIHQLYDVISDSSFEIVDAFLCICEFNESLGDEERVSDLYALDTFISLLEDGPEDALRMYEFVTENCEVLSAICRLLAYNSEYLTDEQLGRLLSIAAQFDLDFIPESALWPERFLEKLKQLK